MSGDIQVLINKCPYNFILFTSNLFITGRNEEIVTIQTAVTDLKKLSKFLLRTHISRFTIKILGKKYNS